MLQVIKPPRGLSERARTIWKAICEEWAIDQQSAIVLDLALRAFDRMNEARAIIAADGLIVTTKRTGAKHQHPAVQIEAQARQQMLQAWKQLGFDVVPPGELGRSTRR